MIYLFLFFRISIIKGDHALIKTLSLSKRISIFFYSKKNVSDFDTILQSQWNKFTSSLEESKKDGTYNVNFDENVEFSEYYLVKQNELPCFLILDRRTISLFTKEDIIKVYNSHNSLDSSSKSLAHEDNLLNQKDQNVFYNLLSNYTENNLVKTICPDFSLKSAKYPAFVFHSNDIQQCKKIRKYSLLLPHASEHFYFSKEVTAGEFYFYLNENEYIIKKLKKSKALNTIREYSYFPFSSSWELKDIRQIKERRVAFVVYSNKTTHPLYNSYLENNESRQIQNSNEIEKDPKEIENESLRNMINYISNLFWKNIVFNKMTLDDFNLLKVKMRENDTPFILITNSRKSKFMFIKNISVSNRDIIIAKLKRAKRGLLDGEMDYNFEPILSVFYEHTRTLLNTLCFTFVALIVVTITTFIIVQRASPCINPHNQIINRRKYTF